MCEDLEMMTTTLPFFKTNFSPSLASDGVFTNESVPALCFPSHTSVKTDKYKLPIISSVIVQLICVRVAPVSLSTSVSNLLFFGITNIETFVLHLLTFGSCITFGHESVVFILCLTLCCCFSLLYFITNAN